MFCSVEVEDVPAVVPDDEETVKKAESRSGYCKEIHGGDPFAMVLQESQP